MADKEHTEFCRTKFPPNCAPECTKRLDKCIKDSKYTGPLPHRANNVAQPAAAAVNSRNESRLHRAQPAARPAAAANNSRNESDLRTTISKSSILEIIHNSDIREDYNVYLNTLVEPELKDKIKLYQIVTSDNFLKVVLSLELNEANYKQSVLRNRENLGFHAFEELYLMVKKQIHKLNKTTYKFLTPRNVMVTEDIESLGISDFASIYRLFTDITYHRKFSSSPSLVFKAKLAAGAGSNSVKARNTLQAGQMFFFKCFPVGKQTIDKSYTIAELETLVEELNGLKVKQLIPQLKKLGLDEKGNKGVLVNRLAIANLESRPKKSAKKIQIEYDTKGLQTEIKMYSELFKLVKYNITPNILCKIATAENVDGLTEFLTRTNMMAQANEFTFNKDINEETLKVPAGTIWETVSLISTHKGGETVRDLFQDLSPKERKQVMFQIIYNMYIFDKLEISQGDLHSENLLINILPEEVELCYIVEGVQYCFKTRHLVKYFDLDRGMIGKTTTLHFDENQTDKINQIVNPVRASNNWVNTSYGVTSIYNKNLEIVNLITHDSHGLLSGSRERKRFGFVYPGKPVDEGFNRFMRAIMPGGISPEKIGDTYSRLLSDPLQKEEADRIFNVKPLKPEKNETEPEWIQRSIEKYIIDEEILDMPWGKYFDYIKDGQLGHIVKSDDTIENNHLWIPDSVILSKINMLTIGYFDEYINRDGFDITEKIVYTIDGMI